MFANARLDIAEMRMDSVHLTTCAHPMLITIITQNLVVVIQDLLLKAVNVFYNHNVFKTVMVKMVFATAIKDMS